MPPGPPAVAVTVATEAGGGHAAMTDSDMDKSSSETPANNSSASDAESNHPGQMSAVENPKSQPVATMNATAAEASESAVDTTVPRPSDSTENNVAVSEATLTTEVAVDEAAKEVEAVTGATETSPPEDISERALTVLFHNLPVLPVGQRKVMMKRNLNLTLLCPLRAKSLVDTRPT